MSTTVTMTAGAAFGYEGKQYIARLTGRNSKFTFEREFIGKKSGKRGDVTEVEVDDPGLYELRRIDKKGRAEDSWRIVYRVDRDCFSMALNRSEVMELARALDDGRDEYERLASANLLTWLAEAAAEWRAEGNEDEAVECERRRAWLQRAAVSLDDPRAAAIATIRDLMRQHGIAATELA